MSRTTGNKRKIDANLPPSKLPSTLSVLENEISSASIDELIANHISKIRAGNNEDLAQRALLLERNKEKQIAAADRHRKLQIKNINQLYDFEVEDAQALYERAYKEVQDELVQELVNERARLSSLQQEMNLSFDSSSSSAAVGTNARSMRSSAPDFETELKGGKKGQGKKKRGVQATEGVSLGLDEALSDACAREDLVQIVQDMEMQANSYLLANRDEKKCISIVINDDCSGFLIEDIAYHVGEEVSIFSILSQETLTGIITAVSLREIVLRTGEGNRFALQISLISTGRLIISKENDILERLRHIQSVENGKQT